MKKSILATIVCTLFVLVGSTFTSQAQIYKGNNNTEKATVISTRPLSMVALQPNIKVEQKFGTNVSGGAELTVFTKVNEGFRIDPFVRFYTNKAGIAPQGFYLQGKLSYGNHQEELGDVALPGTESGKSENFNAAGGGFGVGSQWFVGANNNLSIDLYGGVRRYKPVSVNNEVDTAVFNLTRSWPAELRFSVGYAF